MDRRRCVPCEVLRVTQDDLQTVLVSLITSGELRLLYITWYVVGTQVDVRHLVFVAIPH